MGRHSRRGPAAKPKRDSADTTARQDSRGAPPQTGAAPRGPSGPGAGQSGWPQSGGPGARRVPGPYPPRQGVPPGGAPGYGGRGFPDGTPAHGFPGFPDGTPAQGVPRLPDGTPAHGFPRFPDGTPAHGAPQARGGHPQQREPGGGWGELRGRTGVAYGVSPAVGAPPATGVPLPRPRRAWPSEGPRQDYVEAFDGDVDVFAPRTSETAHASDPYASVTDWGTRTGAGDGVASDVDPGLADPGRDDGAPPTGEPVSAQGGKGRTFSGIAAAAVVTVLAVVVAGQVAQGRDDGDVRSQSAADEARDARDPAASRGDGRPTPSGSPSATPLTYEQKMGERYALSATLEGSGKFEAIRGVDKAPGRGQKFTYRVDVEQGLGLDGELFAEAVQKTLNDDRSWAHNGAYTFERVYSGKPDFVITLASPGTTADWCAKSGLDTTVDNVSCDSAATERVMINAYRWAQGSKTYGDRIHAYRQMLINHEVGHRLGYPHVTCDKDGELAPVMQQQTKFLDHDGIHCRANPWVYPGS
ncbi:DUF3152 domain-containing protein [Streptomyces sp. NPDC057623]|uniref:DUF3152 domain-containing protein n=1 Tax=Streptomyces sp. NPDC057623 TaxID=3346187 RepID=UPI0036886799